MSSEVSWFFFQSEFKKDYRKTIDSIKDYELSPLNKILLRKRFIPILKTMELEVKRVSTAFTIFQIITTLGSIVVPALLSIEDRSILFNSTDIQRDFQTHNLYWTTWAISIAVTISNAFNQLLGLEKKYIIRNIHLSQMKKEGWSFLEKSGNIYGKDVTPDDIVYHEDENVAISSSDVELSNANGPDYIQRGLVITITVEAVAVLILALAVGLPKFISNMAGGG